MTPREQEPLPSVDDQRVASEGRSVPLTTLLQGVARRSRVAVPKTQGYDKRRVVSGSDGHGALHQEGGRTHKRSSRQTVQDSSGALERTIPGENSVPEQGKHSPHRRQSRRSRHSIGRCWRRDRSATEISS